MSASNEAAPAEEVKIPEWVTLEDGARTRLHNGIIGTTYTIFFYF